MDETEMTVGELFDGVVLLVEPSLDGLELQELWCLLDEVIEERLAGRPQPSFKEEARA